MTKTIKLLSHGLFEKPFMDSRVKSRTLSKKEEILGHLVGPLGLIFVVNTIAALVENSSPSRPAPSMEWKTWIWCG